MFKSVSKNYTPDFLESFMARIRGVKALDEEQEVYLAQRIKAGDTKAEEQMIKSNLKMVVSIANSYSSMMSMEDLIQNGNIGLIKAVREFNPEVGYRFVFYASMMIRKYIIMGIRNDSGIVHSSDYEQAFISSESLDVPGSGGYKDTSKADMLVGDMDVESDLDSLSADLKRAMCSVLSPCAVDIVCKVMGLGCTPMYTESIGKELNMPKSRVRKIYQESIEILQNNERVKKLLSCYQR
jgi:RNA polymerase primary sigma factor